MEVGGIEIQKQARRLPDPGKGIMSMRRVSKKGGKVRPQGAG